jgi:UDP-glucose 4-epimerase
MRIVVFGATGNIGTATVERLLDDRDVTELVGVARRPPVTLDATSPGGQPVRWEQADIRSDDLVELVEGADAVVHLAWMFQPSRRPEVTWEANAVGTSRLLEATRLAAVPRVVVVSSVAAYSPRRDVEPVDESWPTHGASSATYAREKAYVERLLDSQPDRGPRITRIRPAFVFQERAASEQRRIFGGPWIPQQLIRPALIPAMPVPGDLMLQAVHASDVADGILRVIRTGADGAFNLCADGILGPEELAGLLDARRLPVPAVLLRGALALGWHGRLLPAEPRLLDALLKVPMMSNQRAKDELGWSPARRVDQVLEEFLRGLRAKAGHGTEPLQPA